MIIRPGMTPWRHLKTLHISGTSIGETLYSYCQTTDPAWQWVAEQPPIRFSSYGSAFIHAFKKRSGVEGSLGKVATALRPFVMALWDTETPTGSCIDVLE